MEEIREILSMSLAEAVEQAKRIRQENFNGMRRLHLVNGYLLGPSCRADCIFCGWNRNISPCELRPKLDNLTLRSILDAAQGASIELINNTIRINMKLLRELETFSWACLEAKVGVSIGLGRDRKYFEALRSMGYSYYVNDLETSPRIFPSLVTTHRWEEKLTSMRLCREAGLSLHSGFIMGFGETDEDLAVIFKTLKEHQVEGVVVNFYTHVNGTPREFCLMTPEDVLRRLAQLRIAFPSTSLILGGGRSRWLGEAYLKEAFQIVDTLYARSFLNHQTPYWLRESEILASMGF